MISQLGSFTKQCWTLSYDLTDNDRKKPTLIKYVAEYSFFFFWMITFKIVGTLNLCACNTEVYYQNKNDISNKADEIP